MGVPQIIFLIVASVTVFSAIMVVSLRNVLHSALWLIMALMGVASMFALLEASFFAVVQILVYIGAIAIMIIFAVMLTQNITSTSEPQSNQAWGLAALLLVIIFFIIISQISAWSGFATVLQELGIPGQEAVLVFGKALVDPGGYALPFEAASVLLLAALLGGVTIAYEKRRGKNS